MAGAVKHIDRSKRSHNNRAPFYDFARKAQLKKAKSNNRTFAELLMGKSKREEEN